MAGVDQTTSESERSEARRQLRSRATPAERDDVLRRWDEMNCGPSSAERPLADRRAT